MSGEKLTGEEVQILHKYAISKCNDKEGRDRMVCIMDSLHDIYADVKKSGKDVVLRRIYNGEENNIATE